MIPIGHKQKPLLEYIIRLLEYNGITQISLLVGYKYEQIVNYFNSGERFGVEITYLLDNEELKGSGGSLLNLYRQELVDHDDVLVIYYGDILSNINLQDLLNQHRHEKAIATLALSKGYQIRVGVAEVNGRTVVQWREKPKLDICAGIGILAINASALRELEQVRQQLPPGSEIDIMSHFVPHLIKQGEAVHSYLTDAFWYDIGSIERYEKLENSVIEKALGYLR